MQREKRVEWSRSEEGQGAGFTVVASLSKSSLVSYVVNNQAECRGNDQSNFPIQALHTEEN